MSTQSAFTQFAQANGGLAEERQRFAELQTQLVPIFRDIFPERVAPQTVIIVPSASVDSHVLAKVSGAHHYEERLLCLLILLRLPRTNLIFVTSQPIHDAIIDYYLHLLPGIPSHHARRRLTLLNCHDASPVPLTQKILERPRLMQRIRAAIPNARAAHLACYNATPLERSLAVQLNVPLYACDPDLIHLGSKSNSREIFREAGVKMPDGFEHLRDEQDMVKGLTALKQRNPRLRRAAIKLNDGFSGEGNAIFDYGPDDDSLSENELAQRIATDLPRKIRFEATGESWERYRDKFAEMKGVVEGWIDGDQKRSPSVQSRINPLGEVSIISTHDQILGGPTGQIYLGCSFPADEAYRLEIQEAGLRVGAVLKQKGALGISGTDFVSVKTGDRWEHYAIEINLRKGGTSFPFFVLQFLTDGQYDPDTGLFRLKTGQSRAYYASDNLQKAAYKGLTPDDLIDAMIYHQLHFDGASQQGVVFHLMGALSEFGKFGVTCIADSQAQAQTLYKNSMTALDQETGQLDESTIKRTKNSI